MIDLFCLYFQLVVAPSMGTPVPGWWYPPEYYEARSALCGQAIPDGEHDGT